MVVVERDAGGGYGGSVKIKGMGEAGAQEAGDIGRAGCMILTHLGAQNDVNLERRMWHNITA